SVRGARPTASRHDPVGRAPRSDRKRSVRFLHKISAAHARIVGRLARFSRKTSIANSLSMLEVTALSIFWAWQGPKNPELRLFWHARRFSQGGKNRKEINSQAVDYFFASCTFFSIFSTPFCIPSYIFFSMSAPCWSTFLTSASRSAELLSSLPQPAAAVTTTIAKPIIAYFILTPLIVI